MDEETTRRAEGWGAWGSLCLILLAMCAAHFTGELGWRVLLVGGVAAGIATSARLVRCRADQAPRLWRWPALTLGFLVLFGQLAPMAGSLAAGFYVVTFVYVGIVARPWVGLALLPVPAVAIWSVLDPPPAQAAVRLSAAMLAIAMASQLPSRLMESLAQRRVELASEHAAVVAAQEEASTHASKFSRLFMVSPVGMGLADEHGRFVEVNPALCRLLGREPAELLGRGTEHYSTPDHPARRSQARPRTADGDDGVVELDQRFVRPDGQVVVTWVTVSPISGPRGEAWTLAHVIDVTDRARAEREAERAQLLTTAVARIAQATQRAQDPRAAAVDGIVQLTGADTVLVIEQSAADVLSVTQAWGAGTEDVADVDIPIGRLSVTAHVWATGRTQVVPDLTAEPMVNPALAALVQARSGLWQPVPGPQGTTAVLLALWAEDTDPTHHLDTMAVLATEVAAALTAEQMRIALQTTAVTDGLTGLLNRRGWDQAAGTLMEQSLDRGQPVVLAMVDLDHFKAYNDGHGHAHGDALLTTVATTMAANLRSSDLLSRWGGDEFTAILPGCTLEAARTIFDRFLADLPPGQSCSVGLTECAPGQTLTQAMAHADHELYAAKAARPAAPR